MAIENTVGVDAEVARVERVAVPHGGDDQDGATGADVLVDGGEQRVDDRVDAHSVPIECRPWVETKTRD